MWGQPPRLSGQREARPLNPNAYLISASAPRNFCLSRKEPETSTHLADTAPTA
jgi:hypothetical protein